MAHDVFISYSRKDFDEVNAFVIMLQSRIPQLSCWFDLKGIESGDEFTENIISAIDASSNVLFMLSDNAIKSRWTRKEIMYAKNNGKKVVPVLLKGASLKGWFLFEFGTIDCIDLTDRQQVNKLIDNLCSWTGKTEISPDTDIAPVKPKPKPKSEPKPIIIPEPNPKPKRSWTEFISNHKQIFKWTVFALLALCIVTSAIVIPLRNSRNIEHKVNIEIVHSLKEGNTTDISASQSPDTANIAQKLTDKPEEEPTEEPAKEPEKGHIKAPTNKPMEEPTKEPAKEPTNKPMEEPVKDPIKEPTEGPYKIGDYYNENGKEGVVFEVDSSGRHGKIVGMKQSNKELPWCISSELEPDRLNFLFDSIPNRPSYTGATDQYDGMNNMRKIMQLSDWRNKYPAFAWCAEQGEDWYLPAIEELKKGTIYQFNP